MTLERAPEARPLPAPLLAGLLTLAALLGLAAGALWIAAVRSSGGLSQPLTITACTPADFDDRCAPGASVDPDTLVLSDELGIEVTGTVCADEAASYDPVTVDWLSIETDARFRLLEFPTTWDEGCVSYSTQTWAPPPQLLALLDDAEPGEDLGRWKIVGTATPVQPDRHAPYQWDSVETFRLVAPEN